MSLASTISEDDRQHLWFEFTKAIMHKRILYKGSLVDKFEIFALFLSKSETITDLVDMISYLLIGKLPNYQLVWKWELLNYRTSLPKTR